MDTVGVIYEILSGNLMEENVANPHARLACAKLIADAVGRNPAMEAPRGGLLLHYKDGDGCTELVLKTDPPLGQTAARERVLKALAETLETTLREH